jgi:hypothetical protein
LRPTPNAIIPFGDDTILIWIKIKGRVVSRGENTGFRGTECLIPWSDRKSGAQRINYFVPERQLFLKTIGVVF